MADFVNNGDVIEVTLEKAAEYHEVIQVGTLAGVTMEPGSNGDTVNVAITGVWKMPADETLTVGSVAYVKDGKLTATAEGGIKAGVIVKASASEAAVKLNV